jgi:hypothetical protein
MDDLAQRFHQTINDNVTQSFNNVFENRIMAALELMIHTTVTNALAAALPTLLAPLAKNDTLMGMETKLMDMETKLTRMEIKLTRVEIMQAKVSVPINI